jgi:glutamine synthetase
MGAGVAPAAALASGLYGIKHKLPLPAETTGDNLRQPGAARLPASLGDAARRMAAKDSVARALFGDVFVDHYAQTRLEEWGLYSLAVTDWEIRRYFELA